MVAAGAPWLPAVALVLSLSPLGEAERAFEEARYHEVLPHVRRALGGPLPAADRLRAHELEAMTHAAFDDSAAAVKAFRDALGVDPTYQPGPAVSPKVRGLFEEARRIGPPGGWPAGSSRPGAAAAGATLTAGVPEKPDAGRTSLFHRWWFWAALGVVAAGAAGGVVLLAAPDVPQGNLPTGKLR